MDEGRETKEEGCVVTILLSSSLIHLPSPFALPRDIIQEFAGE